MGAAVACASARLVLTATIADKGTRARTVRALDCATRDAAPSQRARRLADEVRELATGATARAPGDDLWVGPALGDCNRAL